MLRNQQVYCIRLSRAQSTCTRLSECVLNASSMVVFISCLLNPPKLTSAVLPKTLTSKAQLGRGKEHVRPAAAWSGHGSSNSLEPTWVQTHRGTPNLTSTKPDNPCKICSGRGKVACGTCEGTGMCYKKVTQAFTSTEMCTCMLASCRQ